MLLLLFLDNEKHVSSFMCEQKERLKLSIFLVSTFASFIFYSLTLPLDLSPQFPREEGWRQILMKLSESVCVSVCVCFTAESVIMPLPLTDSLTDIFSPPFFCLSSLCPSHRPLETQINIAFGLSISLWTTNTANRNDQNWPIFYSYRNATIMTNCRPNLLLNLCNRVTESHLSMNEPCQHAKDDTVNQRKQMHRKSQEKRGEKKSQKRESRTNN